MVRDPHRLALRARHRRFYSIVTTVVKTLPGEVQSMLDNIAIVVEEEPLGHHLLEARLDQGDELLGLYQGIPQTERDSGYSMVTPDHIIIFAGPLTRSCGSRLEIRDQIRITILHELGHHLGYDEDGLDSLGLT